MSEVAESADSTSFDMESAVSQVSDAVFGAQAAPPEPEPEATPEPGPVVEATVTPVPEPTFAVPKSWPKEMHQHWGKTPKEVQTYWTTREKQMLDGLEQYKTDATFAKTFRESLQPYEPTLKQLGIDPVTAARHLFQADHILRYAPAEQRKSYFLNLAKQYGIALDGPSQPIQSPPTATDPLVQSLQSKLNTIEQSLMAREQAELQAAQERTTKEVDAFASDTNHPYFEDVADDMTLLIKAGLPLKEAYEKAVWANPVTRQKELQRLQTEEAEKAKENARLNALPKKKAMSANVRSLDSRRAPTEPIPALKDMDQTIRESLNEIKARA